MRKATVLLCLSALLVTFVSCFNQKPVSPASKAVAIVEMMARGDFAGATTGFDDKLKKALSPQELETAWKELISQAGAFKKQEGVETSRQKQDEAVYDVVLVKCEFERSFLGVRIAFNVEQKVAGLFFVPTSK